MALDAQLRDQLSRRFDMLLPQLDERQKRLALGTEARLIGHGGVRGVALAAQVSEATVRAGVSELVAADSSLPVGRSRRPGGGRKPAWKHDPGLVEALLGPGGAGRAGRSGFAVAVDDQVAAALG